MTELTTTFEHREKMAQLAWTGIILGFFLIQAIIWTIAISITANDQSHAVVAGYDEKALKWDDEKAQQQSSNHLGWATELLVDPAGDIRGIHGVTIQLKDAKQIPLSGATIEVEAFHCAKASQPQKIKFDEINDGTYAGFFQLQKAGKWQFTGTAKTAEGTYLINERHELKADK